MKLTFNQLRRIIKEEVQKVVRSSRPRKRSLREMMEEDEAFLEIPDVSVHAEGAGMTVDEFVDMVIGMGRKYPNIEFGPANALDKGNGYSREYDSLLAQGSRSELESLARDLDDELQAGAQSIGGEDSFVNFVQDL